MIRVGGHFMEPKTTIDPTVAQQVDAYIAGNPTRVLLHLWKGLTALAAVTGIVTSVGGFVIGQWAATLAGTKALEQMVKPAFEIARDAGAELGKVRGQYADADALHKEAMELRAAVTKLRDDAATDRAAIAETLTGTKGLKELVEKDWPGVAQRVVETISGSGELQGKLTAGCLKPSQNFHIEPVHARGNRLEVVNGDKTGAVAVGVGGQTWNLVVVP